MPKLFVRSAFLVALLLCSTVSAENLKNVITVSAVGGDFTDINSALDSIFDASESNPYLIDVGPGVYQVRSQIVMKAFVSIRGSGRELTRLTGRIRNSADSIVLGQSNTTLSELTIESIRNFNFPSIAAFSCERVNNCGLLEQVNIDVETHPLVDSPAVGVFLELAHIDLKEVKISAFKAGGESFGLLGEDSSVTVKGSEVFAQTAGISFKESVGIEVENSAIGGTLAIDTSAFVVSASLNVRESKIRGNVRIVRNNPDGIAFSTIIRSSIQPLPSSLDVTGPLIELIGVGALLRCVGNDNGEGLPLDNQCAIVF